VQYEVFESIYILTVDAVQSSILEHVMMQQHAGILITVPLRSKLAAAVNYDRQSKRASLHLGCFACRKYLLIIILLYVFPRNIS
jgi:hypothetical protein